MVGCLVLSSPVSVLHSCGTNTKKKGVNFCGMGTTGGKGDNNIFADIKFYVSISMSLKVPFGGFVWMEIEIVDFY